MAVNSVSSEAQAAAAAAVAASNARAGLNSKPTDAQGQINADFNFFLKMLTTQLKHQDPTEPMDVSQMTQQIAQYSGVEQQVKTNTMLEKLLTSNRQSQLSTAVGYIGKEIETEGNKGTLIRNGDQAQASFCYILPREADEVKVKIKNAAGAVVFSGSGTNQAGRNITLWDGKNSFNGEAMPPGTYTIEVEAKDATSRVMEADLRSVIIVDGVETDRDGNILFSSGDSTVKFDEVLAVRDPIWFGLGGNEGEEGGEDTTAGGDDDDETEEG